MISGVSSDSARRRRTGASQRSAPLEKVISVPSPTEAVNGEGLKNMFPITSRQGALASSAAAHHEGHDPFRGQGGGTQGQKGWSGPAGLMSEH